MPTLWLQLTGKSPDVSFLSKGTKYVSPLERFLQACGIGNSQADVHSETDTRCCQGCDISSLQKQLLSLCSSHSLICWRGPCSPARLLITA